MHAIGGKDQQITRRNGEDTGVHRWELITNQSAAQQNAFAGVVCPGVGPQQSTFNVADTEPVTVFSRAFKVAAVRPRRAF
jgi:hypothetical protein